MIALHAAVNDLDKQRKHFNLTFISIEKYLLKHLINSQLTKLQNFRDILYLKQENKMAAFFILRNQVTSQTFASKQIVSQLKLFFLS